MGAQKSPNCLHPSKKNPGKVPKRIHKAEREKMKREHLNELFLELAGALELREQNSGKAAILGETSRVVKEMVEEIKSLKKENAALMSESEYVRDERNELEDETCGLEKQISELKRMVKERSRTKLDLNAPAAIELESVPHQDMVFVIHPDPNPNPNPNPNVSKPCPRYPTDSWPFQIIKKPGAGAGAV